MKPPQESENILTRQWAALADRLDNDPLKFDTPSVWMEENFWVPERFHPVSGDILPAGPILLADHQKALLDEALSRDEDGFLKYAMVIYSAPKKSGKSALASAATLYMAHQNPFSNVYLIANDAKQSDNRLFHPIARCVNFHRQYGGIFKDALVVPSKGQVTLANGTIIDAIPCDAVGEAGSEPIFSAWSEIWGYMKSEKKKMLWTEMTPPPTKQGRAMRWVESYAGVRGVSDVLEGIYNAAVRDGIPHPDFEHMRGRNGEPVVWINPQSRILAYWDTEPRMVWQTPNYYRDQKAQITDPMEYDRVHHNQWVTSLGQFVQESWWLSCRKDSLPELFDDRTPVVIAIDAATEGDCAAAVAVTRDPDRPDTDVAIRASAIFKPRPGHSIILSNTIGRVLHDWGSKWNVVCIAYDSYQMKKMAQDYSRGIVEDDPDMLLKAHKCLHCEMLSPIEVLKCPYCRASSWSTIDIDDVEALTQYRENKRKAVQRWWYQFGQQKPRAEADKQLHDMILAKQISWKPQTPGIDIPDPNNSLDTLDQHIRQAGRTTEKNLMRLQKLSDDLKIDAVVALSMAVDRCLALDLSNQERDEVTLREQWNRGEIAHDEYMRQLAAQVMEERYGNTS